LQLLFDPEEDQWYLSFVILPLQSPTK